MRRISHVLRLAGGALVAAALGLSVAPFALPSHAADSTRIAEFDVSAEVAKDGALDVTQTVAFEGTAPAAFVQRFATQEDAEEGLRYTFALSGWSAQGDGKELTPVVATEEGVAVVTLPTAGLQGPLTISYKAAGASRSAPDGTSILRWPMLQGLPAPVTRARGTLSAEGFAQDFQCVSGKPGATKSCRSYGGGIAEQLDYAFSDGPLEAGDVVVYTLRYAGGVIPITERVSYRWTLDRAFSTKPLNLAAALAVVALGGAVLWFLLFKRGRDAAASGSPAVAAAFYPVAAGSSEFRPVDGMRPGLLGTVKDEQVDPIDVTATLLDLAVRGHLRITELPRASAHAALDWTLSRLTDAPDDLRPYERTLLDAVAPVGAEPTPLSTIARQVLPALGPIQAQLYDDVVAQGWFANRPDSTRRTWSRVGWAAVGVSVAALVGLVALTTFGLTGLALLLFALGLLLVARDLPARTAKGSALLAGLQALAAQLAVQPTNEVSKGAELAGISRVLPYAVVLGGKERWLEALAAADLDQTADSKDLGWYFGPDDWKLGDLPASLGAFIVSLQGHLVDR